MTNEEEIKDEIHKIARDSLQFSKYIVAATSQNAINLIDITTAAISDKISRCKTMQEIGDCLDILRKGSR